MTGRVGPQVAYQSIHACQRSGSLQMHIGEPIAERTPKRLSSCRIAVYDYRKGASRQVTWKIPTFEFQALRFVDRFAVGGGGIGIAAVCAYQAVDHEFQHAWPARCTRDPIMVRARTKDQVAY